MFFSKSNKRNKIIKRIGEDERTVFSLKDIFPDPNLAKLVADKIGVGVGEKGVTLADLNRIMLLEAANRGITSLEGLEFLNNLRYADFSDNAISKLPDYSKKSPNLYKLTEHLITLKLANNPLLDSSKLFSLDATTNRKKFLGAFDDYMSRVDFGDQNGNIYTVREINPRLIQMALERILPRSVENRNEVIDELMLKYIIAKDVFYDEKIYQDKFFLNDGRIQFNTNLLNPKYLDEAGIEMVNSMVEEILPQKELYLIRALVNQYQSGSLDDLERINRGTELSQMLNYYRTNPEKLSTDYIKINGKFTEAKDYSSLKASGISSSEEATLSAIKNSEVRDEYAKYLDYRDILNAYRDEHPDQSREIAKTVERADEFTTGFLKQYLSIQDNIILSEEQKKVLDEAKVSFKKFIDNFVEKSRSFFDQDIFGLEVEMKYVDMLAEADRKFSLGN